MTRLVAALLGAVVALPAAAHDGVAHAPAFGPGLIPATGAQVQQVTEAVARYRDFAVAEREGWKKFGGDEPLTGEHWFNPKGPDYKGSDARLDFSRPSNLMYTQIGGRRVLTGVTFNVRLGDG